MAKGRVYVWEPSEQEFSGGRLSLETVNLSHLWGEDNSPAQLSGRYVDVVNAQKLYELDQRGTLRISEAMGNAVPNALGDFIYDPGSGGYRPTEIRSVGAGATEAAISASHFGEVNVYWHLTSIAAYVEHLLFQLGEKSLPRVLAVIGARTGNAIPIPSSTGQADAGGSRRAKYRFPETLYKRLARFAGPMGQIVFPPGASRTDEGWLPRLAGSSYLCNTSHIAGFIYQAYGEHIVRHTADVQANDFREPGRQVIHASTIGRGVSKFWAASMLSSPFVWSWHCRHDPDYVYPDNLKSSMRIDDLQSAGTQRSIETANVLASALWDLKTSLDKSACELLVLAALIKLRSLADDPYRPDRKATLALRSDICTFAACLLQADAERFKSANSALIAEVMKQRGIDISTEALHRLEVPIAPSLQFHLGAPEVESHVAKIVDRFPEAVIPADDELVHPDALEKRLTSTRDGPYDVVAVGDVMTGMRMRHRIRRHGPEFPFAWVKPVLRRATVVTGNLEGPFAQHQELAATERSFSYKVDPKLAPVLRRGGFNAMTIANNHILDCGHEGVDETLNALENQRIEAFGGGRTEATAHEAAVFVSRGLRIGLLGYYWNKRTSARKSLAGSAQDLPELVERDFSGLRKRVDRIVVMVHWGVPYERNPTDADRAKARFFIECGADAVIGHHPHIIQPMEIYRKRPILYSVGNFAFGSGNSKAESLMPCIRFGADKIELDIYALYVQNRDLRVDYQPKIMRDRAAAKTLKRLELWMASGIDIDEREFCWRVRI